MRDRTISLIVLLVLSGCVSSTEMRASGSSQRSDAFTPAVATIAIDQRPIAGSVQAPGVVPIYQQVQDETADWNAKALGRRRTIPDQGLRGSATRVDACDPTITNPYLIVECSSSAMDNPSHPTADQRISQVAADHIASLRTRRDAGQKLTTAEITMLTQADANAALAAEAIQAQASMQAATEEYQRRSAELARRQRLAECTAAADLAALSVQNFWGGLAVGLATGAICMN